MKPLQKILYSLLVVGFVASQFVVGGAVVASVHFLKYWAYPTFFGIEMLLAGFVLAVLIPAEKKSRFASAFPRLRKFLKVDEARFSKGIWPWFRRKGPFALVFAAALFLGAFFAAFVIRFLGLTEHKAWLYAFVSALLAVVIRISILLGALGAIRSAITNAIAN